MRVSHSVAGVSEEICGVVVQEHSYRLVARIRKQHHGSVALALWRVFSCGRCQRSADDRSDINIGVLRLLLAVHHESQTLLRSGSQLQQNQRQHRVIGSENDAQFLV